MAYDKKKLYEQCLQAAKKKKIFFVEDLIAFIPCDKSTFYTMFRPKSDEFNAIKELLEINVIKKKHKLKGKLYDTENVSGWVALYKLIGTNEERRKLSQSFQDHTSLGDKITGFTYADPDDKADD